MGKKLTFVFIISALFFSFSIFTYAAEKPVLRHYKITLTEQEDGSIKSDNHSTVVSLGSAGILEQKTDFLAQLYSLDNDVLTSSYFVAPDIGDFVLKLPYYPTGKEVKIFSSENENNELFSINVQVFAQVCGDNECQAHESYENCPEDCLSGGADDYCDHVEDGICDADCQNIKDADNDCTGENPATIAREIRERTEAAQMAALTDDINKKLTTGGSDDYKRSKPDMRVVGVFMVLIVAVVSLIIFVLLKKDDK